jgi:type I restriction enzyme M protein
VLFIDARQTFTQIDRAHREFTEGQVQFIANIVRLYREEPVTALHDEQTKKHFPKGKYRDVAGLCKVATIKEVEAQGWSLNPGRYVGVAPGEAVGDDDFKEQLESLNEELETLNTQACELEQAIARSVAEILEG